MEKEIERMGYLKTTTVPVTVGTLGIIKRSTDKHINDVPGFSSLYSIQKKKKKKKKKLCGPAHLLRKVLSILRKNAAAKKKKKKKKRIHIIAIFRHCRFRVNSLERIVGKRKKRLKKTNKLNDWEDKNDDDDDLLSFTSLFFMSILKQNY